MKITEFTATAEILGKPRTVKVQLVPNFDPGINLPRMVSTFVIEGLDADEAQVAVQLLSRATYTKTEAAPADASPPQDDSKKESARKGRKPAEAKADTSAEAKKEEPVAASPTEPKAESKQETLPAVEEKQPEPPKEEKAAAKPKKEKPAAAAGATKVMELPDNIKQTGSMKELLNYMVDHGVSTPDELVAQCVALRADVPVLTKVPDVDARVRRAVEVLGLFASDEAAPAN